MDYKNQNKNRIEGMLLVSFCRILMVQDDIHLARSRDNHVNIISEF